MTPSDLQSLAASVYGARWQSQLGRDMGIALRTVQRWARDGIDKTATAEGVRRFLEERRIARIAAPPEGSTDDDDRDDACRDALEPAILSVLAAADDIGWHRVEAQTAVLASVLDDMVASSGIPATIETLRGVISDLKARRDT